MGCCEGHSKQLELAAIQEHECYSQNEDFQSFNEVYYYSARNQETNDKKTNTNINGNIVLQFMNVQTVKEEIIQEQQNSSEWNSWLEEIAQTLNSKKKDFLTLINKENSKWEVEKNTSELQIHKQYDEKGIIITRGEGIVNCSADDALNFLLFDIDCFMKTKPQMSMSCNYRIEKNPNTQQEYIFQYSRSKGNMFLSEREFLFCKTYWKQEDGSYIGVAISIDDKENYPMCSKFARAQAFLNGYLISPKDNDKCQLVCLQHAHPGGSVPISLANKKMINSGQLPVLLNQYLKTHQHPVITPLQKI